VGVRLAETLSTPEFSQVDLRASSFDRDERPENGRDATPETARVIDSHQKLLERHGDHLVTLE
jgi:hypothetical protein